MALIIAAYAPSVMASPRRDFRERVRLARGGRRPAGRVWECSQRDVPNSDRDGRAPQFELIPKPALSRRLAASEQSEGGNQMKAEHWGRNNHWPDAPAPARLVAA